MLRPILLFLLGAGLISSTARAEETKVAVRLSGIGASTCAHWRSSASTRAEGTVWILGFWSGLNYVAAASDQTQPTSTDKALITETVEICAAEPSQILASAAWAAYLKLAKK